MGYLILLELLAFTDSFDEVLAHPGQNFCVIGYPVFEDARLVFLLGVFFYEAIEFRGHGVIRELIVRFAFFFVRRTLLMVFSDLKIRFLLFLRCIVLLQRHA